MAKETKAPAKTAKPSQPMSRFEEFDRLFENFFPSNWMRRGWDWPSMSEMAGRMEARVPKVDVIDRDKEVVVRAEVPGVDKKDLDVSVSENSITIKGCTREEHKEEDGDYHRSEIRRGSFSRTLPLPAQVDADKGKGTFKDGILELTLPKISGSERRTIKVE